MEEIKYGLDEFLKAEQERVRIWEDAMVDAESAGEMEEYYQKIIGLLWSLEGLATFGYGWRTKIGMRIERLSHQMLDGVNELRASLYKRKFK